MAFTGGDTNGTNMAALVLAAGGDKVETKLFGGAIRCFAEAVTLATQAKSKTIGIGVIPAGAVPLYGIIVTDTSLASATISIGDAGDPNKYRVDAVLTALLPELYTTSLDPAAANGAAGTEQSVDEELLITNSATATLPASGFLKNWFHYMTAQ